MSLRPHHHSICNIFARFAHLASFFFFFFWRLGLLVRRSIVSRGRINRIKSSCHASLARKTRGKIVEVRCVCMCYLQATFCLPSKYNNVHRITRILSTRESDIHFGSAQKQRHILTSVSFLPKSNTSNDERGTRRALLEEKIY